MTDARERLERVGMWADYESARVAGDLPAMAAVLERAGFRRLEIDAILWAKGDLPPAPGAADKRRALRDEIIGRAGVALITGVVLGGLFVYFSSGLGGAHSDSDTATVLLRDRRTPAEAYYRPFAWGFGTGVLIGLVAAERLLVALLDRLRGQG